MRKSKSEKLREQYSATGLALGEVEPDPLAQFKRWLEQARAAGIPEPNAMSLATVSPASAPSQRSVLMKGFDPNGFLFFTNHASRKARQMREKDAVSALFPWYALHRQVIIEGNVRRVGEAESLAYFHSRPREAQLGAWASRQSETLESRRILEARMMRMTEQYLDREVPLPAFWGGYRIRPHRIEFWQGRTHRLHDRILYTRRRDASESDSDSAWEISRLSP